MSQYYRRSPDPLSQMSIFRFIQEIRSFRSPQFFFHFSPESAWLFQKKVFLEERRGDLIIVLLTAHKNVSLTDRGRDLCRSCGDVFGCSRQILCALGASVRRRCAQLQEIIPHRLCCAVDVIRGRPHTRHIITAPSTPLVVAGGERPVTNVDAWWPSARTSSRGLCNEERNK